ncbi:MAG: flagellar MS-ring protein [Synergistetes bacterium ADurb.BinA166]|nr:MAG: flagellar MS-ring protein [Synergistetes bacterium ADurb.BinA166]
MESLRQSLNRLRLFFRGLAPWQRWSLVGAAVLVSAALLLLVLWSGRTTYEPLFANLDVDDQAAVVHHLPGAAQQAVAVQGVDALGALEPDRDLVLHRPHLRLRAHGRYQREIGRVGLVGYVVYLYVGGLLGVGQPGGGRRQLPEFEPVVVHMVFFCSLSFRSSASSARWSMFSTAEDTIDDSVPKMVESEFFSVSVKPADLAKRM